MLLPPTKRSPTPRKNLWFERLMAIVALANLGLVIFDLTYLPLRNFWLLGSVKIPALPTFYVPLPPATGWCKYLGEPPDQATLITECYDRVKGIEAYRDTQTYLDTVNQLEQQIQQKGLQSTEATATLESLRSQSDRMVSENWFQVADKSGTLEKIKDRMRERIYVEKRDVAVRAIGADPSRNVERAAFQAATRQKAKRSSKTAFSIFWSPTYLAAANVQQELNWFDTRVRHLIQTNYYRSIEENGEFTNNFWLLDLPFVILFAIEFTARTWYISRRFKSVSWRDAILWRWYDILLFFPFGLLFSTWAWLRVIPVVIRLHQAELIDAGRAREQATQGLIGSIAEELTEVVVIQVLNQLQVAIRQGEITRWLLQPRRNQVTVNNVDELAEIVSLFIKLTVYQVLPKVQPDIEALLKHNVESVLNQSPAYQTLTGLPGLGSVPTQLVDRLVQEVIQALYSTLTTALEDRVGAELGNRLVQHFIELLGAEVQEQKVTDELKSLVNDFIEEVKLNYVKRSADVNVETLLEETRQLQQSVKKR